MIYDIEISTHKTFYHVEKCKDEIRSLQDFGFQFVMPEESQIGRNMRSAKIKGPIIKKFGSAQNFLCLCQEFGEIVLKADGNKLYAQIYNPNF